MLTCNSERLFGLEKLQQPLSNQFALSCGDCFDRSQSSRSLHTVLSVAVARPSLSACQPSRATRGIRHRAATGSAVAAPGSDVWAERCIGENKQAVKTPRLRATRFRSNEVQFWLSLIAYDHGNLWPRLVLPTEWTMRLFIWMVAVVTGIIGFPRIYLGVHSRSDVIAGY